MIRTIVVFLIGFFLGGFFGGDLGLLINKTKSLVFQDKQEEDVDREYKAVDRKKPNNKIVYTTSNTKSDAPAKRIKTITTNKVPHTNREKVYTIQVASFKTKNQADKFVTRLNNQQYDAYVAPSKSAKSTDWYRVCIGETLSLDQAKSLNSKLKPKFKDSFIYWF